MSKQVFLSELDKALSGLSEAERKDILRDIEEYFHESMSRGRSEQEVLQKLGSVKTLSETIIAEAKVKRINSANSIAQKIYAIFGALIAILLLTPFNLIFVLFPLLLATFFIIIGWPVVIAIAFTVPIVFVVLIILVFQVGFKLFALLALLFFAIGWVSMSVVAIVGFIYLTLFYFKGIARLFQWNIKFIKNRMRSE